MPDRFIRSALNRSKAEVLKDLKKGKDTLSQFVLKKKIGTSNQLLNGAIIEIEKLGNQIQNNLAAVKVTQKKISTSKILDELVKQINKAGGAIAKQETKDIVNKLAPQAKGLLKKPTMSLTTANRLRQSLDRTLGDKAFLGSQLTFNKEILRGFTNTLRNSIKEKAPEGTKQLFKNQSLEIQLRDAFLDKVAKQEGNRVLRLSDFLAGGFGGLIGGGPVGAIIGAAVLRTIESTPFKQLAAKNIDIINKILPILNKLEPAGRKALLEIIKSIQKDKKK